MAGDPEHDARARATRGGTVSGIEERAATERQAPTADAAFEVVARKRRRDLVEVFVDGAPARGGTLRATFAGEAIVLVEPTLAGTSTAPVSNALSDVPHRLLGLGVPNTEHRHYGTPAEHDAAHGLDAAGLRRSITAFLEPAGRPIGSGRTPFTNP